MMFSKKLHADVKKSTVKIQDLKKDSTTRLKHLKIILDHLDVEETRTFFETNFSHIYFIFYDSFINAEASLRQRVHKAHREELDYVLSILEKLLIYLPELLAERWQCHSLTRVMTKLLHPGNSWKYRREYIRYFILWYQILGDNAPDSLHAIFATLVPGFTSPWPGLGLPVLMKNTTSVFHDVSSGPVCSVEIPPLLPPQSGEKQLEDPMRFFLDALLEFMVSQVIKIAWRDRHNKQLSCFTFLFEKFKQYYLPHIFPEFSHSTSLYNPILDLPVLRRNVPARKEGSPNNRKLHDPSGVCKVVVIKWVTAFTHITKKSDLPFAQTQSDSITPSEDTDHSPSSELRRVSVSQAPSSHDATSPASDSNNSVFSQSEGASIISEDPMGAAINIVKDVFYSNRDNVNFIHEIYRQAFLLNFAYSQAIRKAIAVYKDWIQMNVPELPPFLLEPPDSFRDDSGRSGPSSMEIQTGDGADGTEPSKLLRLRNDSYIGAIHKENLIVRAGLQNLLQIFITHAANVFMLEIEPGFPLLLEEQVDMCKRVLNIYRYMVMHTRMECRTWEQLLLVLLQITSVILNKTNSKRKEDTLGGKLAPAIFQTLIVTWIKANLNVVISVELWDHFLLVLSSLTHWEELIREWAKTLETLTRVLARHVYNLDLTDLPLDRLTEQKTKKRRAGKQLDSLTEKQQIHHGSRRNSDIPNRNKPNSCSQTSMPPDGCNSTGLNMTPEIGNEMNHPPVSPIKWQNNFGDSSHIPRSVSEGNLIIGKSRRLRSRHTCRTSDHICGIQGLPVSVEKGVARLISSSAKQKTFPSRRSRSMDSLRSIQGSHYHYTESECPTRSPSPAPSSGIESNSIKDSPMQIDVLATDATSLDIPEGSIDRRSVMAGGPMRGWLPDVASVLWRRMLCALGDINEIDDQVLHHKVFDYLVELFDILIKIRMNQGVSGDNQLTPSPPELIPPIKIIAPWCFKAVTLSDNFLKGKLCAYQLLCQMTVTSQDILPCRNHITQFYKVLHQGLIGRDEAVINTLIQYCGPHFFSLMLPGFSLLIYDFIHAANSIVSSHNFKMVPRTEATSILGTLLCLFTTYTKLPVLQPNSPDFIEIMDISCANAKDHVLPILVRCGKKEPTGLARCIALSSLGIFLYQELTDGSFHPKIKDALNVILLALQFNNRLIGQIASDILLLLCDHVNTILEHFSDMAMKIIEVLASTLSNLIPAPNIPISDRDRHLISSIMFCLGDWCMRIPIKRLVMHYNGSCLLLTVFKVLNQVLSNTGNNFSDSGVQKTSKILENEMSDFDPDILLDNLCETGSRSSSYQERNNSPSHHYVNQSVQLAAKMVLMHLVNHLGHFPMGIGPSRLSSLVVEHDDVPALSIDELSVEIFSAANIQLFILSNNHLVSLVELPTLDVPGGGVTAGLRTAHSQVRVILRDLSGKACWDASVLYGTPEETTGPSHPDAGQPKNLSFSASSHSKMEESLMTSSFVDTELHKYLPQHTLRHRKPDILPTWENAAEDMDNLDDLLQYIGYSSPECLEGLDVPRNIPGHSPLAREVEEDTITMILNQRNSEQEYLHQHMTSHIMQAEEAVPQGHQLPQSPFHHSRLLFSQLGLAGWDRRSQLHLLSKNEKLLRELRNLDSQRCRETHKIAVIYVAEGQEDKSSILSNTCGSQAYEEFIAGLAWEVELESHTGFLGGLQRNKSTGETAPYYATSFTEVVFHVATRMPSSSQESLLQKTRHLGNDEVHIVWSEHSRDYRRGIIPTEFCDVLIVIYPLPNSLYRIQVSRKPDVPYFGPLFNEAIVGHKVLPGLVRASAISASRAKRSMLPLYQNYYEERAKSLETVVCNHKNTTTFEDFAAQVFSPVQTISPFCAGPSRSSGTSLSSRSPEPACSTFPSSTLAAALIDSHHYPRFNFSQSVQESQLRGEESVRVWFAGSESSSAETTLYGISPRPLKKLSFKTPATRKSLAVKSESVSLTPPDSPTTRKYKN